MTGKLIVIMSIASRSCLVARFYENQHDFAIEDCFQSAISRYGVPREIHVNHGDIFVSGHFHRVCSELGVHLIEAPANHLPQTKRRIEKILADYKRAFYPNMYSVAHTEKLQTLKEINDYMDNWLTHHNNYVRPDW